MRSRQPSSTALQRTSRFDLWTAEDRAARLRVILGEETVNTDVMFSRKSDEWGTPRDFFDRYHAEFKFTIDGAAIATNALLRRYYGPLLNADDGRCLGRDALLEDWTGERVWLNPPYSMCAEFVEKAVTECSVNDAPSCILVPARTDTKWFHEFVYYAPYNCWHPWIKRVDFVKGRLKFVGAGESNSAPFPSVVIVTRGF